MGKVILWPRNAAHGQTALGRPQALALPGHRDGDKEKTKVSNFSVQTEVNLLNIR